LEVAVRVHGALRSAAAGGELALSLPEDATAGDLLARLADRFGPPFAAAAASPDPRLPRQIRIFVGSEMVVSREQRLAPQGGVPLTVVVMSPVAGG
jgi:molybdopterin converting factor small subunit